VYSFRPFHNWDLPALCRLWNEQPPQRGLARHLTPYDFEQSTLGKPYFDREGLIVALADERLVGFAHAGFGCCEEGRQIETDLGVTCMLMVDPAHQNSSLPTELLRRSESYLAERGAKVFYGGGIYPLSPFYWGLYGGSELPGTLASDQFRQDLYRGHGYGLIDQVLVYQLALANFRPVVNRQQMQWRRQTRFEPVSHPAPGSWWQAWTNGVLEPMGFRLISKRDGRDLAMVTLWDLEPLSSTWNTQAAGVLDVEVVPEYRRQGLATFLLTESIKQLRDQGVNLVEVQAMQGNQKARGLYERLGFAQVDQGTVLRKGT